MIRVVARRNLILLLALTAGGVLVGQRMLLADADDPVLLDECDRFMLEVDESDEVHSTYDPNTGQVVLYANGEDYPVDSTEAGCLRERIANASLSSVIAYEDGREQECAFFEANPGWSGWEDRQVVDAVALDLYVRSECPELFVSE